MTNAFDLSLLQVFNSWTGMSAYTFYSALWWSNNPAWVIAGCTLVALWFSERTENAEAVRKRRGQVFLLFAALIVAFVMARGLGFVFERPRPLAFDDLQFLAPIDPVVWAEIRGALKMQGAFPSDHGAMFAVITVGVFLVNIWLGFLALAVNLFFPILRIGIGFHWPTDMLVGELIGVAAAFALLQIQPYIQALIDWILGLWDRFAYLAYPLAFLLLLDFTQKFSGLFTVLDTLKRTFLD